MTVYLIGGPPKCGKTTLAKILSKSTSIPRISADTLENIARTYIDKANHKKAFPHGYVRGDSNDVFYTNHTSASIVE
ncbi:MAG: AAA family ATPase [bacterium]